MPIDSRDKRFSLMGMGSAFVRLLQNPSATIAQSGRQLLEFLYSGILAAVPSILGPADPCDTFFVYADGGFSVTGDPLAFTVSVDYPTMTVPGCG